MRANAWWPIPIGEAEFTRGERIDVQPIPGAPHDEQIAVPHD